LLTGESKYRDDFASEKNYWIHKFLDDWVRRENILLFENVVTNEDFNSATSPYIGNIQSAVYMTHASPRSLGLHWEINAKNITKLNKLNDTTKQCSTFTLTIAGCNSGKWDWSIAEKLSSQLGVTVVAPNWFISTDVQFWTIESWFQTNWEPTLWNFENIKTNPLKWLDFEWRTFIPKN
jgi:hypothetical protein